jgi:Ca-activated chloride channel family protein
MQPLTPALTVTGTWDRPFVARDGGTATLLLNLVTPATRRKSDRIPVDVTFVLDRSGSMGGDKLALAKQAILSAVSRLTDRDRIALVVYDNEVDTLLPLLPATATTQQTLRSVLKLVDARGSTNLSGGWLRGCGELADAVGDAAAGQSAERIHRAILLTDGQANQGIVDPDELATHAQELRRRGITTTTLGVGLDVDGPFLSQLAEAGGGNFAFIEHPAQLAAFFAAELDELVSIAARSISVAIAVPAGATLDLLNPYPTETGAGATHIAVGDLPDASEVELVAAMTFPPAANGSAHDVAVRATWRDTDGTHHDESVPLAPIVAAPAVEVDAAPANVAVLEATAIHGTARLQREAARSAQRHDYAAVSAAHLRMSAVLQSAPASDRIVAEQAAHLAFSPAEDGPMAAADVLRMAERGFASRRRREPRER